MNPKKPIHVPSTPTMNDGRTLLNHIPQCRLQGQEYNEILDRRTQMVTRRHLVRPHTDGLREKDKRKR